MGVMNLTPNSFSDGGEITPQNIKEKILSLNQFDILDVGAESTAPMNESISADEEWRRLGPFLEHLHEVKTLLSLDTYHPETIFKFSKIYSRPFIWNDISGKFDSDVERFLQIRSDCYYVFSHNLSPSRDLSGKHMNYLSPKNENDFLDELVEYFSPFKRRNVIFDPCLGFSKSYEQNWYILDHLDVVLDKLNHPDWLIGFSRKSFLRKKYQIELSQKDELDQVHLHELYKMRSKLSGNIFVRTHRPELLAQN